MPPWLDSVIKGFSDKSGEVIGAALLLALLGLAARMSKLTARKPRPSSAKTSEQLANVGAGGVSGQFTGDGNQNHFEVHHHHHHAAAPPKAPTYEEAWAALNQSLDAQEDLHNTEAAKAMLGLSEVTNKVLRLRAAAQLKRGGRVRHSRYGEGTVVGFVRVGEDPAVSVRFDNGGERMIDVQKDELVSLDEEHPKEERRGVDLSDDGPLLLQLILGVLESENDRSVGEIREKLLGRGIVVTDGLEDALSRGVSKDVLEKVLRADGRPQYRKRQPDEPDQPKETSPPPARRPSYFKMKQENDEQYDEMAVKVMQSLHQRDSIEAEDVVKLCGVRKDVAEELLTRMANRGRLTWAGKGWKINKM